MIINITCLCMIISWKQVITAMSVKGKAERKIITLYLQSATFLGSHEYVTKPS